jgi:hypothetical protein
LAKNIEQSLSPLHIPFPGHDEQLLPVTTLLPRIKAIPASIKNKMYLISFLKKSDLFILYGLSCDIVQRHN